MTSAADLIAFEQQHKLTHPYFRDEIIGSGDFKEWEKTLRETGGRCPCIPERICPCEEALEEIANAPDANSEKCTCATFCTQAYLDHHDKEWHKDRVQRMGLQQALRNKITPTQEQQEQPVEQATVTVKKAPPREIKSKVVLEIITTLRDTRKLISKHDWKPALELMEDEINNPVCEMCKDNFTAVRNRILLLISEQTVNKTIFDAELARAFARIAQLIELYTLVDIELEKGPAVPRLDQIGKSPMNDYHHCVSNAMKELKDQEPDQHKRLGLATGKCRRGEAR